MSETTTLLKVGSAELVLRLIEAGIGMRDFTLENPIRAIRDMSRDRTGRVQVALANGRRISALELQTEYYDKVSEYVRRDGIATPTIEKILDLWERTLRAVTEDKLALVVHAPRAARRRGPGDHRPRYLPGQVGAAADHPGSTEG
jgi:proteasome accessory factor A